MKPEQYARSCHEGQMRKCKKLPYIVHPEGVAKNLQRYGFGDETSQAIAWLHDTIEDTPATHEDLKRLFNTEIADGVLMLTREGSREDYQQKLRTAPERIKIIKLCDVLDNVRTIEALKPERIERMTRECAEFYLPMARELCPRLADDIKSVLEEKARQGILRLPEHL